jgi:superfamily II DNA/RNA helicase
MVTYSNLIDTALAQLGIEELNPMQQASLQAIVEKQKDMILLSPTGSGKTLAYLLPLLQLLDVANDQVQALVMAPSRELALQITTVFNQMNTPFKAMACYGGHPTSEEHRSLQYNKPQLVVGTPGRILDHIEKGNIDPSTITTLIIDEFDKSLEYGFQEEMEDIISQLHSLTRRILLSATDAEQIPRFTGMNETVRLDYLDKSKTDNRLDLRVVNSPDKDKLDTLYKLLCALGSDSTIVFVNYRESVDRVSQYLTSVKLENGAFHGGMEQQDRERALYKFRNGSCHVLVSTDLASRGLDIPEIKNIVHYHLPVNQEAFTHRNGRTARWDAEGTSYIILNDVEHLPEYITQSVETYELPENVPVPPKPIWATLYIGKGKKDKLNKTDIVGFLCKKGGLNNKDIGLIDVKDHYSFVAVSRKKLNQTLNQIEGEKIKSLKTIIEEAK